MVSTITFNRQNEITTVSNLQVLEKATNPELVRYLEARIEYALFCDTQTKRGQARKNERARVRYSMFADFNTESLDKEILELRRVIFLEEDSKIEKIKIKIEYDSRKDFSKISEGVKMAYFTGVISEQYYNILGLVNFTILN